MTMAMADRKSQIAEVVRPVRVKLSRSLGFRLPANTVKCDRTTIWGNPYAIGGSYPSTGKIWNAAHAVSAFRSSVEANPNWKQQIKDELRGKNLACWCPLDQPCHCDVMLQIANAD